MNSRFLRNVVIIMLFALYFHYSASMTAIFFCLLAVTDAIIICSKSRKIRLTEKP